MMQQKDFRNRHLPNVELPSNRKKKSVILFRRFVLFFLFAILLLFFGRYLWKEKRWRYIVIHHTASDIGNMDYYRRLHIKDKGWPDIAYHFVINNGSFNTTMGQIEESNLWKEKTLNYSTKVSYINYFGIAVVLVGNFDLHGVSPLQWESLVNLSATLAEEYNIPPERIVGHREIWETACPGKYLDMVRLREDVGKILQTHSKKQ